jgi:hypothetical protein
MDKVCLFATCLSAGMAWTMTILPNREVNPGYYRSSILVILGLVVLALLAIWSEANWIARSLLIAVAVLVYLGSIAWQLQQAFVGKLLLAGMSVVLLGSLWEQTFTGGSDPQAWILFGNAIAAAALLGVSMSAMLLGHYYLTAPWMTLTPLYRLLVGIGDRAEVRIGRFGTGGDLRDG